MAKKRSETFTLSKGSMHGSTPFRRAGVLAIIVIAISLLFGVTSYFEFLFSPPDRLVSSWEIISWMTTSLLIPYLIVFLLSMVGGLFVLSGESGKYVWWIAKQGMPSIVAYLLGCVMVGTLMLGVAFQSALPAVSTGISVENATMQTYYMGLALFVMYAWFGYRCAWAMYRLLGAQTMQDRYEADLASMERKVSGRFWEKYVEPLFLRVTGMDGHKPRGGVVFFASAFAVSILGISLALYLEASFAYPIATVAPPSIMVLLWAAISKYRDGRYSRLKPPILQPRRNRDTEDTYNPSSKGIRTLTQD